MKVTMKDIAKALNVSINAVSIALNDKAGVSEEMRLSILQTAKEMGYLEGKDKYGGNYARSNLCLMMQNKYSGDMDFYGKVLYSVVVEARKNGYNTIMNFIDDEQMEVPECIRNYQVSGIITIGKISHSNIRQLIEYHLPFVMVDHTSLMDSVDSILTNNKLGGYLITKYLIERGFTKIGFFGDLDYSLSINDRFFGYKQALQNDGIDKEYDSIDTYVSTYSITKNIENAVLNQDSKKVEELIKNIKAMPEVFICSNDKAAIALMMVLWQSGYRIPEEISVVGFDNIDLCERVVPKLTTVHVNKKEMGERAVQRLKYRMEHKGCEPESIVLNVEIVERDSVR